MFRSRMISRGKKVTCAPSENRTRGPTMASIIQPYSKHPLCLAQIDILVFNENRKSKDRNIVKYQTWKSETLREIGIELEAFEFKQFQEI